MNNNKLIIELPPPGTLIRDLAITFINIVKAYNIAEVTYIGDEIILTHKDLTNAMAKLSKELSQIHSIKNKYVRWPPLHKNDKGTLEKVISKQTANLSTYGDIARYYIEKLPDLLGKGGRLTVEIKRNSIQLGQGILAMFQLFNIELYEKGLSYNKPYQLNLKVRFDEAWASLLLSGFVASHMGIRGGDGVVLSATPDITDPCSLGSWMAINLASTLYNVPTNPTIPYILYIYATAILLEDPGRRKSMLADYPEGLEIFNEIYSQQCENIWDKGLNLRIHRISITGRTFTEIYREDLTIGGGIARLSELCENQDCRCLEQFRDLARMGLGANNPDVVNALTVLYEALIGSKNPAEATYYLARVVRDQEVNFNRL